MKDKTRKVYFSAVRVRMMLSNEEIKDLQIVKTEVFDRLILSYQDAVNKGDYSAFQTKVEDDVLMVSKLHYVGNCLCGIVGRGQSRIQRYIRECNPETFGTKELTPSEGHLFEEYSYFAISTDRMQIAYLSDPAVASNIPLVTVSILRQALGNAIYEFELDKLLDYDIKAKLKQLTGEKIIVNGILANQETKVLGGMRSLSNIEGALGTKMRATIKLRGTVTKRLTDEDIDVITEMATTDEGFKSFTFADEMDADKEVIDVISRQAYKTKKITISKEEQQDQNSLWEKLCGSFSMR